MSVSVTRVATWAADGVGGEAQRGHQRLDALARVAFGEGVGGKVHEAVYELEDVDVAESAVALGADAVLDLDARAGGGNAEVGERAGEDRGTEAAPPPSRSLPESPIRMSSPGRPESGRCRGCR